MDEHAFKQYDLISAVEGGTLTVRDMDYPDAGEYMCSSMNEHDSFNATITVRVKGQSISYLYS